MRGKSVNTGKNQHIDKFLTFLENNSSGNSKYGLSLIRSLFDSFYPGLKVERVVPGGGLGSYSFPTTALLSVVLVLASFVPR